MAMQQGCSSRCSSDEGPAVCVFHRCSDLASWAWTSPRCFSRA